MLVQPVPDKTTYNLWAAGGSNLPVNLFSHSDQSSQWQNTRANGISSTGWGGRLADYMPTQNTAANSRRWSRRRMRPLLHRCADLPTVVPARGAIGLTATATTPRGMQGFQQLITFDNGLQLVRPRTAWRSAASTTWRALQSVR